MIGYDQKKGIFSDPKLQEEFHENGFVIVPFVSSQQIEQLFEVYKSCYPDGVEGFFTTTFANNVDHREKVNQSIREICIEQIENLFVNYKILFSSFIVKAPGENSRLIMHQDMTLVDEKQYSGINIWCPMVDLTETNGAIEVLPKSHRFYETYRGSSIPDIYDNVKDEVASLMQPCYLKAGEAIIFDQSIIHNSPPNLSHKERPTINTFVAHQDAKIKICYWDKESYGENIEIFEQEDDFLEKFENFGHNIFSRPSIGKSLGLFPYDFPKLTVEQIERELGVQIKKKEKKNSALEAPRKQPKQSWIKRLFSTKTA
ncbi:MAG: phytanoyl-CoA dioxygenase family protein [Flavobacteriales bacterium]|nr:phytanoyl-CoA dioxygenase family protein [Flavobacteriales bacterium]